MRSSILLIVAFCLLVSTGCAVSEREEIDIGRRMHRQFEQEFGGLYPDQQVQEYVNAIGMSLARHAGRPNLDWQFRVVNSEQINAFAVPGGYCYVTQGLLYRMSNEAQLAGVLGHEAAHVQHRHSVRQLERARGAQGLTAIVGVVGGVFGYGIAGDITGLVSGMALMRYGRDQEREADRSGLDHMVRAGYNPQGIVQTMQVLQQAGGRGGPEFLSSHPNPENRIGDLQSRIENRYAQAEQTGTMGEQNFQRIVLSRRRGAALPPIDLSNQPAWCLTCRIGGSEVAAVSQGELLRDVSGSN